MGQTDGTLGGQVSANGLRDGTDPPRGCRLPLRHGSMGWRPPLASFHQPPSQLPLGVTEQPETALAVLAPPPLDVVQDRLYSGGSAGGVGNGWIDPGPYALGLQRQPPKLRVWNSRWMAERVGQATQRALRGSAVLTQPIVSPEAVAAAVAEAARCSAVPPGAAASAAIQNVPKKIR
jgi:hypothetical protein